MTRQEIVQECADAYLNYFAQFGEGRHNPDALKAILDVATPRWCDHIVFTNGWRLKLFNYKFAGRPLPDGFSGLPETENWLYCPHCGKAKPNV